MFRQWASVNTHRCTHRLSHIQLQTHKPPDSKWKWAERSIGAPCGNFTSHCTPFASGEHGFKKEQGLLSRHVVVRIHKAEGAHAASTWSTLSCRNQGLTATCYLTLQGLKLIWAAWRLIFDKHLFFSNRALSQTVSSFPTDHYWVRVGLREGLGVWHLWSVLYTSHVSLWPNQTAINMTLYCRPKVNMAENHVGLLISSSKWGWRRVRTHTRVHVFSASVCVK